MAILNQDEPSPTTTTNVHGLVWPSGLERPNGHARVVVFGATTGHYSTGLVLE